MFTVTLMIVILKVLGPVSDMPKDKGDEWKHVNLIEESGVSTDGKVRLAPLLKCLYCEKSRFSGGAVRIFKGFSKMLVKLYSVHLRDINHVIERDYEMRCTFMKNRTSLRREK